MSTAFQITARTAESWLDMSPPSVVELMKRDIARRTRPLAITLPTDSAAVHCIDGSTTTERVRSTSAGTSRVFAMTRTPRYRRDRM
jgi:hypothetical protein